MVVGDWQALALRLDDTLPQTQCTRCGYPNCAGYAHAIAQGEAAINQCPPGGAEGVARLAALTGQPVQPLNPQHGNEGPRTIASIEEDWCIGCTLCIKVCPTDAILGANKLMHSIMAAHCTGCELCVPVCPVDCITLHPADPSATGWNTWTATQAEQARQRYQQRQQRLAPVGAVAPEHNAPALLASNDKRAAVAAALAKARTQRKPLLDILPCHE